MLIGIGFLLIMIAALIEAFSAFGRVALPEYKPGILKTPLRWVVDVLWVMLLIAGGAALLFDVFVNSSPFYIFVIGIIVFWLVLPFLFYPILQRRLLPHWEEVKRELTPKGLNENNYWRDDWWKLEEKRRKKKQKPVT